MPQLCREAEGQRPSSHLQIVGIPEQPHSVFNDRTMILGRRCCALTQGGGYQQRLQMQGLCNSICHRANPIFLISLHTETVPCP